MERLFIFRVQQMLSNGWNLYEIPDIAMQIDILGYERVSSDCIDCISDRVLCVVESLQPMVKINAAKSDGIDNILMDSTLEHQFFHLLAVHVAGTTVGVGDDHDFLYTQFINGNQEATHGRVEWTDNQSARILDELGISILQSQGSRQKLCQTGVHTGKDGKFLVWVFARKILLVTLAGYELLIILNNFFYNHSGAN